MDDLTRKNQIEKIDSLIKKQNVSRRDFFGTLGKIAVLSQVVALGAGSFLASCVAFEDKKGASNSLKTSYCIPDQTKFTCADINTDPKLNYNCSGGFGCGLEDVTFDCGTPQKFYCHGPGQGDFTCPTIQQKGLFSCSYLDGFHYGACGNCGGSNP